MTGVVEPLLIASAVAGTAATVYSVSEQQAASGKADKAAAAAQAKADATAAAQERANAAQKAKLAASEQAATAARAGRAGRSLLLDDELGVPSTLNNTLGG